jgi:hypothetical protein
MPVRCCRCRKHGAGTDAVDRLEATRRPGGRSAQGMQGTGLSHRCVAVACWVRAKQAEATRPCSSASGYFVEGTEDPRERKARHFPELSARTPKEVACLGARDCGIIENHEIRLAGDGSARYAATLAIDSAGHCSAAENSPARMSGRCSPAIARGSVTHREARPVTDKRPHECRVRGSERVSRLCLRSGRTRAPQALGGPEG